MTMKPKTRSGYSPEETTLVRGTTLTVATSLGDMLEDDLVVIGGLVPTLLIEAGELPEDVDPHVGTTDLDLGLAIAVRDDARYQELRDRLLAAGFAPAKNEAGNELRQTWVGEGAQVDFSIPQGEGTPGPGKLQHLRGDFAAVVTPGLHLAFKQRVRITLKGKTLDGAEATREIPVCGPGAYVVLKALAHKNRRERKDAYDLYYLVRYYKGGPDEVGRQLAELLPDEYATLSIDYLNENFMGHDQAGPRDVAMFLTGDLDDDIQADVVGTIAALLDAARNA